FASARKRSARSWMGEVANAAIRNPIKITKQKKRKRKRKIGWRYMEEVRCKACRTASAILMNRCSDAPEIATARGRAVSNGALGQLPISSLGLWMFVGEP